MCGSTAWIEVQHAVPSIRIALQNLAADIGAGIGVKDVELTRPFEDLGHHARYTRRIGDVDS
jgi:hypothetical protein